MKTHERSVQTQGDSYNADIILYIYIDIHMLVKLLTL